MTYRLTILAALMTLIVGVAEARTYGQLQGAQWGTGKQATVVILHGDVSGGSGRSPANYHYRLARQISKDNRNATVVALLRPGYHDGDGRKSPGTRKFDQYTRKHNDMVAEALKVMKKARPNAELIVVGHSGGAAQLGTVIGRHPGVVDTAILMACPCHLTKWRQGRRPMTASQSPHRYVSKISKRTKVIALTGAKDDNTTPALAQDFIARAKKAGLTSELYIIKGEGHQSRGLYNAMYKLVRTAVRD